MNNTIHLFRVSYVNGGRCLGSETLYAKDYKTARGIANSRCARYEQVGSLEKVEQRKTSNLFN